MNVVVNSANKICVIMYIYKQGNDFLVISLDPLITE